ncbi:hypothetical protein QFC22_006737 [Naganishia vaughanmartiniae]|uniref:Uncharacterized protein n=1 Tax=Naganishia vaughanmartiniae TaxID=1424756 RepID=A0ACC2WFG8_9TREE|nr:hypothetical protein QFC22_006737 [Naganishia vaughanmartiniae]
MNRLAPQPLDWKATGDFCIAHADYSETIPLGYHAGWPKTLEIEALAIRVLHLSSTLRGFIQWRGQKFFANALKAYKKDPTHWRSQVMQDFRENHGRLTPGYFGPLGRRVINRTPTIMSERGLIPQVFQNDVIYPFTTVQYIDSVLGPEVSISLMIEDMALDDTRYSKLYRRNKAYMLFKAGREFGRLLHPVPPAPNDFTVAEALTALEQSSWDELDGVWMQGVGEDVTDSEEDGEDPVEGRLDNSVVRTAATSVTPPRVSHRAIDIAGTYHRIGDANDAMYVPPMRGAPLPFGVAAPSPVDGVDQERLSQVRSPRTVRASLRPPISKKARRLKRIPTAAEFAEWENMELEKAEAVAAKSAEELQRKRAKKTEQAEEKQRQALLKMQKQQQATLDRAEKAAEKQSQKERAAEEKVEQKLQEKMAKAVMAAEDAEQKARAKLTEKLAKEGLKKRKKQAEAAEKEAKRRKKEVDQELAAIEKGRAQVEKEKERQEKALGKSKFTRPKPRRPSGAVVNVGDVGRADAICVTAKAPSALSTADSQQAQAPGSRDDNISETEDGLTQVGSGNVATDEVWLGDYAVAFG